MKPKRLGTFAQEKYDERNDERFQEYDELTKYDAGEV